MILIKRCYSHYNSHPGRFQKFKRIHSTVDFNVFFQRSFTTTENTQWSLTYKVFIPLGSLYINTETLKKGFFFWKHETPSQMAIYMSAPLI